MGKSTSVLVAVALTLLAVGIVVLASVSGVKGSASFDDPHYFLKRQVAWLLIALVAGVVAARFDYHWWQKSVVPLAGFTILLLILVIIPGIGTLVGGGRRWFHRTRNGRAACSPGRGHILGGTATTRFATSGP